MGSVYEVEHRELGKRFVLKALLREFVGRNDLVQRLRNEWRALGKLEHPNIVSVSDAGIATNGVPYYVMERLQGETLGARLRATSRLGLAETIHISTALLDGLSAAHAIGVVHRDIKPPNIYITLTSGIKILDFGIAKLLDGGASITSRGYAIGTPRYMSPEQASGGRVDGRADLYAVGLLMFEMLSGQSPFERFPADQMFKAHVMEPPPALSELVPGIPSELNHLVARLLEKEPQRRPRSAEGAATTLRAILRSVRGGSDTVSAPLTGALTPMVRAAVTVPDERSSSPGSDARVSVHPGVSELGPTQQSSSPGLLVEGQSVASTLRLSPAMRAELQMDPDALMSATRTSVPSPRGSVHTPAPVASSPAPASLTPVTYPPTFGRRWGGAGFGAGLVGSALALLGVWVVASHAQQGPTQAAVLADDSLASHPARVEDTPEAASSAPAAPAPDTSAGATTDRSATQPSAPHPSPSADGAIAPPADAPVATPGGSAGSRDTDARSEREPAEGESTSGGKGERADLPSVETGDDETDAEQPAAPSEESPARSGTRRAPARGPASNPWADEASGEPREPSQPPTERLPRRNDEPFGRRLPGSGLPGL